MIPIHGLLIHRSRVRAPAGPPRKGAIRLDVDGAWARYERGLACYEEGGYHDHAAAAREMWEQAAAS